MTDTPTVTDAVPPPAPPPQIDLNAYVAKYILIRDKISEIKKRHEQELAPLQEVKAMLDGVFGEQLSKNNTLSMRTDAGTIMATVRQSATLEDPLAFRTFVQKFGEWDLADVRANAPAVKEYADKNKQLPPGVKYSAIQTISVRRASTNSGAH